MVRAAIYAYEMEAGSPDGDAGIDKARWMQGPVESFDAVSPGEVLTYGGVVRLKVLAVAPEGSGHRIVCGVLEPSTRLAFKLLRKLPQWKLHYAA